MLPEEAGRVYGLFRAIFEGQGSIMSNNDLWIAAHARVAGLILVTNNIREFRRLPSITLEDWVN
jgi:tRNA(fMet)-specific endonuclease VapC